MTQITIPYNDRTRGFPAAGGETELDLDFPVMKSPFGDGAVDLRVFLRRAGEEIELAYQTDFAVTGIGLQTGAKVILAAPALADDLYVVDGARPPVRITQHQNHRSLKSTDLNDELNRMVVMLQEAGRDFARALKRSPTAGEDSGGGWDLQGLRLENVAQGAQLSDAATIRDVIERVQEAGGGDMMREIYDPRVQAVDAFHMDSMTEGEDAKIMTAAERAQLIGLGPDGTPQFSAIQLGHASDTTVARSRAGVLSVAGDELAFQEPRINIQAAASYVLEIADKGSTVVMTSDDDNALTVPAAAAVAYPVGAFIHVLRTGLGVTTIAAGAGVTINGVPGGAGPIMTQWQGATLCCLGNDTWVASGDVGEFS